MKITSTKDVIRLTCLILNSIIAFIVTCFFSSRYIPLLFGKGIGISGLKEGYDLFICLGFILIGTIISWRKDSIGGSILVINSIVFMIYFIFIKSSQFHVIFELFSIFLFLLMLSGIFLIFSNYTKPKINSGTVTR
jgi:hypothetical protein